MDIQVTVAIASVVLAAIQTVVVILATIFAVSQLRENTRSRQLDAVGRILEYVSSEDIRSARKKFGKIQFPSDHSQLDEEQIEIIETVLRSWGRLALFINLSLLTQREKDVLLMSYSWPAVSNWQKVRRYIEFRREQSGRPELWSDVEELARRAAIWRKEHNLKQVPTIVNEETRSTKQVASKG
jgi:hypothetical protein